MPCLTEVARLMKEQLTLARDRGLVVKVSRHHGGGAKASDPSAHSLALLPESHPHWGLRRVALPVAVFVDDTCSDFRVSSSKGSAASSQNTVRKRILRLE